MKIELKEISIREVSNGYLNDNEEGVVGYGGKLNIRPKYQREFVYKDKQRDAVIETVQKNFPLNVMYWVKNEDDTYEVLDGQQRTISICEYVTGSFSLNSMYLHNLTKVEKDQILDYKLMVAKENKNSPDLTHVRTFKMNDTLALMSESIYQNNTFYIDVAKNNKLLSFRKLSTGQKIKFPPIK